ncbi:hypothetical protein ACFQ9X_17025 [Catenulispora yoronensis]
MLALVGCILDPAVVPPHTDAKTWARFCAKTVVTSDHVIWVAGLSDGYGTFYDERFRDVDLELLNHKPTLTATRWHYTAWNGPIEQRQRIMHRCELPICVRLDHLEPGTQQANIKTAAAHDRLVRRRGRVRVDRADVRGAAAQSRAVRFAVLEAVNSGVTDPTALSLVVAAAVALGDPDALSAQAPLFLLTW